jgi:hypothetical protein
MADDPKRRAFLQELVSIFLSADEHQHESRGVGRDVGVSITCARSVERQRTAVEDKQRASTSTQAQFEAGSEGSGLVLVQESSGRQSRDKLKRGALDREQSVVTLYWPLAPSDSGDVMAVDQAFLEQVTSHRRRRQAGTLQPIDGGCSRTRRDVVELVCKCPNAIREYGWIPFAVLGQHLRVNLGHSRRRHYGFRDRSSGHGVGVESENMR